MVLVLQRKLSDAHLKRIGIGMQTMKERKQDVEHSNERSQASLDVGAQAVSNALEVTDDRDHRQSRLDRHALIPGAFGTQFEVRWNALLAAKAQVAQDNRLTLIAFN